MAHKNYTDPSGFLYLSVTESLNVIAKPALYFWYAKHGWAGANRIKEDAGRFGTSVHDAIEAKLKGKRIKQLKGRAKELVDLAFQFVDQKNFFVFDTEVEVINESEKYNGTADMVGYFKDKPECIYIGDWKTGYTDINSNGMQLDAYAA